MKGQLSGRVRGGHRPVEVVRALLRVAIVGLTFTTAAIHVSLGGVLFLMNAVGYTLLAVAMIVPGPLARVRPVVRLALLGFTGLTIAGWLLFGARFPLAYLDKAIETALVALLVIEMWTVDGGPAGLARSGRRYLTDVAHAIGARI